MSAIPKPATEAPAVERLAYRLDEVAASLGVCRRSIEGLRSSGRFPKPDKHIGKCPLWTPDTLRAWLARGDDA